MVRKNTIKIKAAIGTGWPPERNKNMYCLFVFDNLRQIGETKYYMPDKVRVIQLDESLHVTADSEKSICTANDWDWWYFNLEGMYGEKMFYVFLNAPEMSAFNNTRKTLGRKRLDKGIIVIARYDDSEKWKDFEELTPSHIQSLSEILRTYHNECNEKKNAKLLKIRQQILSCDNYKYIGDKSTGTYHKKDCPIVDSVNVPNLQGCGYSPESSGFKPCPTCIRKKAGNPTLNIPKTMKPTPDMSVTKVMKEQIKWVCSQYGLHVEFSSSYAYVTSIAGEWFFNFKQRPIDLHHKNNSQWTGVRGGTTDEYHLQQVRLNTPLAVLAYIYHHENAEISRQMGTEEVTYQPFLLRDNGEAI